MHFGEGKLQEVGNCHYKYAVKICLGVNQKKKGLYALIVS